MAAAVAMAESRIIVPNLIQKGIQAGGEFVKGRFIKLSLVRLHQAFLGNSIPLGIEHIRAIYRIPIYAIYVFLQGFFTLLTFLICPSFVFDVHFCSIIPERLPQIIVNEELD